MKTLQESLFDKDLTTKELTLRHAYVPGKPPIGSGGANILLMFSGSKLLKYPNPYHYDIKHMETLECLSGIIMDMPVPSKSDIKQGNKSKWCKDLKEKLDKYINHVWKQQWNESIEVRLVEISHELLVEINLNISSDKVGTVYWTLDSKK